MLKNSQNSGTEEIALVTPTPVLKHNKAYYSVIFQGMFYMCPRDTVSRIDIPVASTIITE